MDYYRIIVAVWMAVSPPNTAYPDGDEIATALSQAVTNENTPVTKSREEDAALEAMYVYMESHVQLHPEPMSWDAKAGVSCGMLQENCSFVRTHTLLEQASWWLDQLRYGRRVCPSSPGAPLCGGCSVPAARRMSDDRAYRIKTLLPKVQSQLLSQKLDEEYVSSYVCKQAPQVSEDPSYWGICIQ